MFRKSLVVVVSALMLCPQVEASTFTIANPTGGTIWGRSQKIAANGTTNAGGAMGVTVSFRYMNGGTEVVEDFKNILTIGPIAGPSTWDTGITLLEPQNWNLWCWCYRWKASPMAYTPPPAMLIKDHFVKITDNPVIAGAEAYKFDQGVMP